MGLNVFVSDVDSIMSQVDVERRTSRYICTAMSNRGTSAMRTSFQQFVQSKSNMRRENRTFSEK